MVRRPTNRTGAGNRVPTLGARLRDLSTVTGLSDADRSRLEEMLRLADDLRDVRPEDLVIIRDPSRIPGEVRDFSGIKLKPRVLSDLVTTIFQQADLPAKGQLDFVTDSVMDLLREKLPKALPLDPVATGKKGADLPIPTAALAKLMQLAAIAQSQDHKSVVWDDGVNQLIVDGSKVSAAVGDGRVTVKIPVRADGVKTTMTVPFAVGSEKRVSGLVMATADRPVGNALVARIWGDALIAFAHQALLAASNSLAGASGRDVKNRRLIPRALVARRGSLTVESQARFVFKGARQ